jgi:hypothetical protein
MNNIYYSAELGTYDYSPFTVRTTPQAAKYVFTKIHKKYIKL